MALHSSAFQFLSPTDDQVETMEKARELFREFVGQLDPLIPEGPDKTFVLRQLRDSATWVNIAITRHPDGTPRR